MKNTLILTKDPFFGFMPSDLRVWLQEHNQDGDLATALAAVHTQAGLIGHELDESNDPWLIYAHEEWWAIEQFLYDLILSSMRQANLCGTANYDLSQKGFHFLVKPFMEQNGFRDGSGWWISTEDEI